MLRCKLCRYFFFTLILFIQLFFSVAAEQRNNKPLMVIGLEQDQYPFQFINTIGELDGVLVDFWRAWAIQQQVDVKFIVNNKSVLKDPIASDSGVNGAFFETAFIKNEVNKAADTNASVTHVQPDNVQAETILLPFSFPQVININKI